MAIKIRFAEETIAIFTSSRPIQRTGEKFSSLQMSQIIVAEKCLSQYNEQFSLSLCNITF